MLGSCGRVHFLWFLEEKIGSRQGLFICITRKPSVLACLSLRYFICPPGLSLCIRLSSATWLHWFLSATQGVSPDRYYTIQGLIIFDMNGEGKKMHFWVCAWGLLTHNFCCNQWESTLDSGSAPQSYCILQHKYWFWGCFFLIVTCDCAKVLVWLFFNCSFRSSRLLLRINNQTVLVSAALCAFAPEYGHAEEGTSSAEKICELQTFVNNRVVRKSED